jgi:hypothetical protein
VTLYVYDMETHIWGSNRKVLAEYLPGDLHFADYFTLTSFVSDSKVAYNWLYINAQGEEGGHLHRYEIAVYAASAPDGAPSLVVGETSFINATVYCETENSTVSPDIAITGLSLQYKAPGTSDWTTITKDALGIVMPCLTPGVRYTIRGAYYNSFGVGPWSHDYILHISPESSLLGGFLFFFFCLSGF